MIDFKYTRCSNLKSESKYILIMINTGVKSLTSNWHILTLRSDFDNLEKILTLLI